MNNEQFAAAFHSVRNNDTDEFRRSRFAPNNKFRAKHIGNDRRNIAHNRAYGMCSVRYCDNGIHGDSAPSLTYSERVFFPQWPVA